MPNGVLNDKQAGSLARACRNISADTWERYLSGYCKQSTSMLQIPLH